LKVSDTIVSGVPILMMDVQITLGAIPAVDTAIFISFIDAKSLLTPIGAGRLTLIEIVAPQSGRRN
jgi:hypothetical protein